MFDKLIGNNQIKEIFERLIKTNRVPHSLLLTGVEGIGKKHFALEIAKSFVCQNLRDSLACDECKNCRRAEQFEFPAFDDKDAHEKVIFSEHADVGMVIPYRNSILVDAIRGLEKEANFRPFESKARLFIIDNADKLSSSLDNAANALLKTLEEPTETTYLILVSSRPDALLPTILSRCQTIRFAPIEFSEIEKYLIEHKNIPTEDAKLLAKISRGSIGKALNTNLENYFAQRLKMLDVLRSLSNQRNFTILLKTAEELSDPKNKDAYEENLKILQTLVHDIWLLKNDSSEEIVNFDIAENLQHLAHNIEKSTLAKWLTEIETLLENLKSNLNRKIATDSLFMQMAK